METIYLDHNSMTPVRAEVIAAMCDCFRLAPANPASPHGPGGAARRLLDEARQGIARLLGADVSDGDRVIFTSGGTEANNLAILGIARSKPLGHVVTSSIEHASVVGPVEHLLDEGWSVDALPVDANGVLRVDHLESLIYHDTHLVTATMANHETGVAQPIAQLAAVCRKAGVPLHSDAVQMAGKLPINFRALDIAAMSISAHKFGGPPGAGAFILRGGQEVAPLIFGGLQQDAIRPGSEAVALAYGLWTALRLAYEDWETAAVRIGDLNRRFELELHKALPNIEIHGSAAMRLPQTSNIAFPGVEAPRMFAALDEAGVACSIGSACTAGSGAPSPTLLAMGLPTDKVKCSLRFSLGRTTTAAEIDEAVLRIIGTYRLLTQT